MFWKVRLHADHPGVTRDRVCDFFTGFNGSVFIVYETEAVRPHYQGFVWWEQSEDNLRKKIRPYFGVTGNKEYGVGKIKDYDAHLRYLCKGPDKKQGVLPDVVFRHAIDINVEAVHEEFWKENARLKAKAKVDGSKPLIDDVMGMVEGLDVSGAYGRREVARNVVQAMVSRNRAVNMFQARGVFNAVMLRKSPEFVESFIDEIISKY